MKSEIQEIIEKQQVEIQELRKRNDQLIQDVLTLAEVCGSTAIKDYIIKMINK